MRLPLTSGFLALSLAAPSFFTMSPVAFAQAPAVSVQDAWARATSSLAGTGAAYLTIVDHGAPDRLVAVATPVAASAAVHQTTMNYGVMRMRPVAGLAVSAAQPVTLAPGGYHIMLTGLHAPLRQGETFPMTLTFEKAGALQVTVRVRAAGASGDMPMAR